MAAKKQDAWLHTVPLGQHVPNGMHAFGVKLPEHTRFTAHVCAWPSNCPVKPKNRTAKQWADVGENDALPILKMQDVSHRSHRIVESFHEAKELVERGFTGPFQWANGKLIVIKTLGGR